MGGVQRIEVEKKRILLEGALRRLRLPDRRDRDDARLLRPRRVGGARARTQDHRRSARHPPPHPARVRGGGAGAHQRGAARVDDVRRDRRRPDRRRAGGRARGDRGAHAGAGFPPLRSAHDARHPDRGGPARAGAASRRTCRSKAQRAARGAGGRGAHRHARHRPGRGLRGDRRRAHRRAHGAVGGGRAREPARDAPRRPARPRRADLGRRRSLACPTAPRCSSPAI